MKWARIGRFGERFAQLRRRLTAGAAREIAPEFSPEELAEFLEGDAFPDDARPEFRHQLREDLWKLVQRIQVKRD
jgi:hypothetical protein